MAIVTNLCKYSIHQLLKTSEGKRRPLELRKAMKIFEETVLGYQEMRAQGLLHRDIKTANILIGINGEARLCDLGFATTEENVKEDKKINVGSPLYMAPEVIKEN
jgi:serine/threonine protein kinase